MGIKLNTLIEGNWNRFDIVIGEFGSRAEAARRLNIQPQRWNEILQGGTNVGTDVIEKSVIEFGFNLFYIFFEKVPFFLRVEEYVTIAQPSTQAIKQTSAQRMHAEPELNLVNEPAEKYEKNLPRLNFRTGRKYHLLHSRKCLLPIV